MLLGQIPVPKWLLFIIKVLIETINAIFWWFFSKLLVILHIAREKDLATSEFWALVRPSMILRWILYILYINCNTFPVLMTHFLFWKYKKALRNIFDLGALAYFEIMKVPNQIWFQHTNFNAKNKLNGKNQITNINGPVKCESSWCTTSFIIFEPFTRSYLWRPLRRRPPFAMWRLRPLPLLPSLETASFFPPLRGRFRGHY